MSKALRALKESRSLGTLPDSVLKKLAHIAIELNYPPEQLILRESDELRGFYLIGSGRVKLYKLSPQGRERIFHIAVAGELFAEAGALAGLKAPVFAQPLDEVTLYLFETERIIELCEREPLLGTHLVRVLSQRVVRLSRIIENVALRSVPGRVAGYLLELYHRMGEEIVLPVKKMELAGLLGTVNETLSRTLRRLREEGIVKSQGRKIKIIDPGALEELATGMREI